MYWIVDANMSKIFKNNIWRVYFEYIEKAKNFVGYLNEYN